MTGDAAGSFRLTLPSVGAPFSTASFAGAVASLTYEIRWRSAARDAHRRHYTYPPACGWRRERNPTAATSRRRPPTSACRLTIGWRPPVDDPRRRPPIALARMRRTSCRRRSLTADDSYRVVLADRDGLATRDIFIRTLEDRPPDVHPEAGDRSIGDAAREWTSRRRPGRLRRRSAGPGTQ
jgi:hypothetical protein